MTSAPLSNRLPAAAASSASVVIPAHNEARVIGRLLDQLRRAGPDLDVIVVCNGCSDGTAAVAAAAGARVAELPRPGKSEALRLGDALAGPLFPRVYIDADVVIDAASVRQLAQALAEPGVHAAGPSRVVATDGCSWPVRAYYRAYARLPVTGEGLFGRGVIALDEEGCRRVSGWGRTLNDDLFAHAQFAPSERRVVGAATSVIRAPRTARDLARRCARAAMGNAELARLADGAPRTTRSTVAGLVKLARSGPRNWPDVAAFAGVTAWARATARWNQVRRRQDWLRDESSRS